MSKISKFSRVNLKGFRKPHAGKNMSDEETGETANEESEEPTNSQRASPSPTQKIRSKEESPTRSLKKNSQTEQSPIDVLNTEFIYYSAVLRTYAPSLTREYDKMTTHLWMRKLFGPEYHSTILKPKRNKYLLYLTISIYNEEAYGIFRQEPPCGALPEIKDIKFEADIPLAAWEVEKQWAETLEDLPKDLKLSRCYLHDSGCPQPQDNLGRVLDAEFQFFLWLSRPYIALLSDSDEKTMAACWVQLLCGIATEEDDCVGMKELRNDYMQALTGYVHDLRVEGPFKLMPPVGPIPPLAMLYEDCRESEEFRDPVGNEAGEFLASQPVPDSGAFAYINVTGELFKSV